MSVKRVIPIVRFGFNLGTELIFLSINVAHFLWLTSYLSEQLRSAFLFLLLIFFSLSLFFCFLFRCCCCSTSLIPQYKPATGNNLKSKQELTEVHIELEIIGFFSSRIIVTSCKCGFRIAAQLTKRSTDTHTHAG